MEDQLFEFDGNSVELRKNETTCSKNAPLPAKLRPRSFDEYVGQRHLLAEGKLLRRAVDADRFSSIILHGPPGTGKTSLAEIIANMTDSAFIRLSGVTSTVADLRREIGYAAQRELFSKRRTVLFIDEIHRFNKAQQDVLLPDVESGVVRLIGATTHNPNFYVIGPLLSRSLVFQLDPLSIEDIRKLLENASKDPRGFGDDLKINLAPEAAAFIAETSEGDARKALNALEIAVATTKPNDENSVDITLEAAEESIQQKMLDYGADGHYDTISAFIKSMRGSDPDAALYWLAKMLHAGEDIRFVARRITIFASEDIGNADPRAITVATDVMRAVEMIGMPEARIILAQATTYCATAPKSNASYLGIDSALEDVRENRVLPVPKHLRDSHYAGAEKMGHGEGYQYPHDQKDAFVPQEYMGSPKKYYLPRESGYEIKIIERIKYWDERRENGTSASGGKNAGNKA
ncbi:MAG: replication-associated recombination protein A [Kiritimatiellaeota bacterium]|nr:replication-associated recombination protein A [Kiritimatiellota bacterium]